LLLFLVVEFWEPCCWVLWVDWVLPFLLEELFWVFWVLFFMITISFHSPGMVGCYL